ncbi:MAG: type II secretion system F family protein [Candidatus Pacebacteria bacterium]|nr:type II secretion system F family protein [Candidatus Paceibacterota bacterium]
MLTDIFVFVAGPLAASICLGVLGYLVADTFGRSYSTYEQRSIEAFHEKLHQIYIFVDPEKFLKITQLITVLAFIVGFAFGAGNIVRGVFYGVALAAIGFVTPRIALYIIAKRRLEKINEQLPDALDMLGGSLRAGLTLSQAIERNASRTNPPLGQEFGVVCQELRLGTSLRDALRHWSDRVDVLDVKLVVIASDIALRLGGNLAETYEILGRLIRDRYMFRRELKAMTSEGRMQAIVMALIPFVLLLLLSLVNPDTMMPFLKSGMGKVLIGTVVVLTTLAYFWIKKIITIEY